MRGISIRILAGCAAALGCLVAPVAQAQTLGIALQQVQAGLERATQLPLEIVRLQADIQADMWKDPALAQLMPDCGRLGAPKEGCSLARFQVAGGGKVFLVASPEAGSSDLLPVPAGRLVLAPGSTVQLVAAGFPSIQIEIKAPAARPLYLGELAYSEVGRILALLVPQAALSASAVDVLPQGKVALRARERAAPMLLAKAAPMQTEPPARMPVAVRAPLAGEPHTVADAVDVLLLDIMPRALVEKIEIASALSSDPAGVVLLDTMPVAIAELATFTPTPAAEQKDVLILDVMPSAIARREEPVAVLADAGEVLLLDAMPAAVQPAPEKPVVAEKPAAPILVAAAPARGATPALSGDLARLRAEVEAEVARDNARLARQLQAPAKTFRFGT
jgi:hypothetical protein